MYKGAKCARHGYGQVAIITILPAAAVALAKEFPHTCSLLRLSCAAPTRCHLRHIELFSVRAREGARTCPFTESTSGRAKVCQLSLISSSTRLYLGPEVRLVDLAISIPSCMLSIDGRLTCLSFSCSGDRQCHSKRRSDRRPTLHQHP